jgi:hypothetical protein
MEPSAIFVLRFKVTGTGGLVVCVIRINTLKTKLEFHFAFIVYVCECVSVFADMCALNGVPFSCRC